ncbi:MAG: amidohydrolase family protein [Candidatus Eisenbacteria bacterium]|uniref:Amidohydrolase family protein n=1 Tax=Eiseniibacteriota bacterium TaxID=2212470 RepID=A0A849SPP9_UNCEI|nr:amidohydrolase family protein [Candidatus Eisenbacteria bacterium]
MSLPDSAARPFAPLPALVALLAVMLCFQSVHAATPRVHAITGARIVTAPGAVIERGTIVIRDGVIVAVGAAVTVPADARVWEAESLTIYPGLIDPSVVLKPTAPPSAVPVGPQPRRIPAGPEGRGAASSLSTVIPETRAVELLPVIKEQRDALRAAGFTVIHALPANGIFRGSSAVVALEDDAPTGHVLVDDAAQVVTMTPALGTYPASLMGAIAVVRQTFLDAKWYRDARAAYARHSQGVERPLTNVSLAALEPAIAGRQRVWFLATDMLQVLRASTLAREAQLDAVVVGTGDEYKRAAEIAAARIPIVVAVNFPDPPDVSTPESVVELSAEELRHWNQAASNAAILARRGVPVAFTSNGLKDPKDFRARVARAIARGLSPEDALSAVTTVPARLLGLADRIGTLAPGKIANLTVVRGPLFDEKSVVREVWIDGARYETQKDESSPVGRWLGFTTGVDDTLIVGTEPDTTVMRVAGRDTLRASEVRLDGVRLRFRIARATLGVADVDVTAKNDALIGTMTSGPDAQRTTTPIAMTKVPEAAKPAGPPAGVSADAVVPTPIVMGNTEAWRMPVPVQPATVLVRNATVWTAGPQGTLMNADLLVRAGKVVAVGKSLTAPAKAVVIDGTGKHVSPGVIDEHSHAAVLGDVNECTNNVTCEVRIEDVVNSESRNLYLHLAGGTTIMHMLHGSCNAIGGQCIALKNKWGLAPDELVIRDMPGTVKFALGENPKQSNWGVQATDRYPKSRAGVEQSIREAFLEARDYRAEWDEYRRTRHGLPPRRDLQLDALVEIIEGRRLVHCHSYRQDEILMLMRLAEEFGFRVNTFTHILEGYKVADELAAHGASAMGFSDWWAYKFEVYDAIPHNGYLMWDRGVNTGFNSDDAELARRLNTEAAKAVKYGGVPPEEAIKFVTLNPARSLKIDARVGSLEPGKDADFVIWNGSPLSPYSACLETWIEGRKYFDRTADLEGRGALAAERTALIERAAKAKKDAKPGGGAQSTPPRYLEETALDGNACGGADSGHAEAFLGEAERNARRSGEVKR